MQNSEVDRINKILADKYGKSLTGLPFFRVVWSDSLFELRKGTFNEYYGSIYLRTYEGVRRVRKYNYIQQRWILERWCPNWMLQTPEIINHDGYEPLYLFEDKNRNPLTVNLRVCTYVIYCLMNPQLDKGQLKQAITEPLDKAFDDDVKYFEDRMEDLDNDLRFKLRYGEAILAPGLEKGEI